MLREDTCHLIAMSSDVAQAKDGAAARRAPFPLDMCTGEGAQYDVKGLARIEQGIEACLEACRRGRIKPMAKPKKVLRRFGQSGNALQRACDNAQGTMLLPEHQDLWLGANN